METSSWKVNVSLFFKCFLRQVLFTFILVFPKKFKNVGDTDEIAVAKKDELLKMSDFFKNSVVIVCCDLKRKLNEKSAFNESMEFTQERKINLVLRPKLNDSMESSPKPTAIVTTEFNSNCLFEVEGQKINVSMIFRVFIID